MSSRNQRTLNISRRKAILDWTERRNETRWNGLSPGLCCGFSANPAVPRNLNPEGKRRRTLEMQTEWRMKADQLITWAA